MVNDGKYSTLNPKPRRLVRVSGLGSNGWGAQCRLPTLAAPLGRAHTVKIQIHTDDSWMLPNFTGNSGRREVNARPRGFLVLWGGPPTHLLNIVIIIIIEGLSLLQSIPPTTANKQTQAQKKRGGMARKLLGANAKSYRLKLKLN